MLLTIRETLLQYSKLLEKITGHIDGGLIMELKELIPKRNNLEISEQLVNHILAYFEEVIIKMGHDDNAKVKIEIKGGNGQVNVTTSVLCICTGASRRLVS